MRLLRKGNFGAWPLLKLGVRRAPSQNGVPVCEARNNGKWTHIVASVVIGMAVAAHLAPDARAETRQIPVVLESSASVVTLRSDTLVVDLGEPAAAVNSIRLIGGGTGSQSLGAINCCERWPRPTPCVNTSYACNSMYLSIGSGATACRGDWLSCGDGSFALTIDCTYGDPASLFADGVETMIVEYGLNRTNEEASAVTVGCWWSLQEPGSLIFNGPLTLEIDYVGAVAEEKTPWGNLKAWYR